VAVRIAKRFLISRKGASFPESFRRLRCAFPWPAQRDPSRISFWLSRRSPLPCIIGPSQFQSHLIRFSATNAGRDTPGDTPFALVLLRLRRRSICRLDWFDYESLLRLARKRRMNRVLRPPPPNGEKSDGAEAMPRFPGAKGSAETSEPPVCGELDLSESALWKGVPQATQAVAVAAQFQAWIGQSRF